MQLPETCSSSCLTLDACGPAGVLQAKAAVTAAERDRKELEEQLQAVSAGIEAATAALQDLQRQIGAAEVGCNPSSVRSRCPCLWLVLQHAVALPAVGCDAHVGGMHGLNCWPVSCSLQAELATDMNAGLSSAERCQLGELQPQIEALEQELKQAKKAASQVRLH